MNAKVLVETLSSKIPYILPLILPNKYLPNNCTYVLMKVQIQTLQSFFTYPEDVTLEVKPSP